MSAPSSLQIDPLLRAGLVRFVDGQQTSSDHPRPEGGVNHQRYFLAEARKMGTSYFVEGRDEGINGSTLLVERVEREEQEYGDALAQLVHSDGLIDGKGGNVIVDLEIIEMEGMGSRRVTDKNRIKAIP